MAYDATVRNIRDGEIVISDGAGTPLTCTVLCVETGLSWTETDNWNVNLCRQQLDENSIRKGADAEVTLSVTGSWTQLLQGKGITSSTDPNVLYEIVNNENAAFTSVATGHYALEWVFNISSPAGTSGADEVITFARVRKSSLTCSEGNERNTLQFNGIDNETKPTIARA